MFSLCCIAEYMGISQNIDNAQAMIDGYKSKDTIKTADFLKLSEITLNNKDYWIVSFTMLYTFGAYDIEPGSASNKITDVMKGALMPHFHHKRIDHYLLILQLYLITNQINMKTQQTNISEVRLVYRTKVKASDRLQVKCSKDAFDIFMANWAPDSIEHIEKSAFSQ